jgi:DNA/RNA endonuclease G (NUC1)
MRRQSGPARAHSDRASIDHGAKSSESASNASLSLLFLISLLKMQQASTFRKQTFHFAAGTAAFLRCMSSELPKAHSEAKNSDDGQDTTTTPQEAKSNKYGHLKNMSPSSPIFVFRPNDYMEIAYDTRTRTPIYVMERLEGVQRRAAQARRRYRFREELSLPPEYRSKDVHYRGSGYDRGHLVPAADFGNDPDVVRDTFALTNAIPQVPSMNKGAWAQLEEWVRNVAEREYNEAKSITYVVSGPLWLPKSYSSGPNGTTIFQYKYDAIGTPPTLVSVPTHLFKVVAVMNECNKIIRYAAFVMPNEDMRKGRVNLEDFLVQWTDLETVAGIKFFPRTTNDRFRNIADALTRDQWGDLETSPTISRRLLLTDGKQSISVIRMRKEQSRPHQLRHLCTNGACRL